MAMSLELLNLLPKSLSVSQGAGAGFGIRHTHVRKSGSQAHTGCTEGRSILVMHN